MSASTCVNCGASAVVLDANDRCAGCPMPSMAPIPHPGALLFLKAFPQVQRPFDTGGGCTAWRLALAGGGYLLITDGDANQPNGAEDEVVVGRYFDNDDPVDDPDIVTWAQAIEYARRAMAENTPDETRVCGRLHDA